MAATPTPTATTVAMTLSSDSSGDEFSKTSGARIVTREPSVMQCGFTQAEIIKVEDRHDHRDIFIFSISHHVDGTCHGEPCYRTSDPENIILKRHLVKHQNLTSL